MKNLQSKIICYLLFATCYLLIGCDYLQSNSNNISTVNIILGGNARTLLPDLPNGEFNKYTLSAANGTTITEEKEIDVNGGTIILNYGNWTITVTAWVTVDGIDIKAAYGVKELKLDKIYHTIVIPIDIPEPNGEGTFEYQINKPSNASVTVKIEPWPRGETVIFEEEDVSTDLQQMQLPSGVYFLTVTGTLGIRSYAQYEIVHIYDQLTTCAHAEYDFPPWKPNVPEVTPLIENKWEDGSITNAGDEQWFSFVATGETHYIHFNNKHSLEAIVVEIIDDSGIKVLLSTSAYSNWGNAYLNNSNLYAYGSVTEGVTYYIKVTGYTDTGDYQIFLNKIDLLQWPQLEVIPIEEENKWINGRMEGYHDEHWFSFIPSESTQYYIHFEGVMPTVYVQVRKESGELVNISGETAIGNDKRLSDYTTIYDSLTSGLVYLFKIRNAGVRPGDYQIAISTSDNKDDIPRDTPDIIELEEGEWENGSITSGSDEQWFSFVATASTQYIHATVDASLEILIEVIDSSGTTVRPLISYSISGSQISSDGSQVVLRGSSYAYNYNDGDITVGEIYHVKVTRFPGSEDGDYQIAFSKINVPWSPIVEEELSEGEWEDGNLLSSNSIQWFSFVATADTQFIHTRKPPNETGFVDVFIHIRDETGAIELEQENLWRDPYSITLTSGQTYYIRVTPRYPFTGTYQIAVSASSEAPGTSN